MPASPPPLVVQYLYVHEHEEGFHYPSVRAGSSPAGVAVRYLQCALTQAACLRLRDVRCELMLATNLSDGNVLGREGGELFRLIEELGVEIVSTEYRHRPEPGTYTYASSRYALDAMLAASEGQPADRQLWFTDLDCVWANPEWVFANAPAADEMGCIYIRYERDWDTVGFGEDGRTRRAIGELAALLGEPGTVPPWIGGELLSGRPDTVRKLVAACDELDARLGELGRTLPTEEQILSLAGAVGRVRFKDLSALARRMPTGARNAAATVDEPLTIGLWHLPSEKGLSLRRAARQIRRGNTEALRYDLADPARAARRFNVAGTGLMRRVRDDGWIAGQRCRHVALQLLGVSS
jgi:hypothetical protein